EVHRWNKAQQDALLPWVENGTVILVGATTENPFFEVNRALVSRSRIFQLKSLSPDDLLQTARRALADRERGYGRWRVSFEAGALEHLVEVAGGDARSLLNALELAVETSPAAWPPPEGAAVSISLQAAEESIQRRAVLYDKEGDYHYDTISAFIKSVRGSDPDGALYWLAKMVRAGEDPAFIFRRMLILASEDVGLADPAALQVVLSCAESFERIGFPEGNFPLAHACLYLATAPKSNSAMAFFDALGEVEKEDAEVPNHLRDRSRDAEGFGHGEGYLYPHAYRDHWAAQQYLPSALRGRVFYTPSESGYEGRIRDDVLRKREIQAAALLGGSTELTAAADGEILSWSPAAKGREGAFKRLESGRGALLLQDRDAILDKLAPARHDRILVANADDGLLLWESLRRVPEGLAAAVVASPGAREALEGLRLHLDEAEKPLFAVLPEPPALPDPEEARALFGTPVFDHLAAREPWRRGFGGADPEKAFAAWARAAAALLDGGALCLIASPPPLGQRVSALLAGAETPAGRQAEHSGMAGKTGEISAAAERLFARLREAEEAFFTEKGASWSWTAETLGAAFEKAGFSVQIDTLERREERLVTEKDAAVWFDREKSPWGKAIGAALGGPDAEQLRRLLGVRLQQGPVTWQWRSLLLFAKKNRKTRE
ncbi:MAG: AAA family ATPase, partial [Treponema sp.]|nr:AAA family ATPase [Treponema sp.]